MPIAAYESGAVRKMRGTPGRMWDGEVRDRSFLCPCAPDMPGPSRHWFSSHTSRGSNDLQNSQLVIRENPAGCQAIPEWHITKLGPEPYLRHCDVYLYHCDAYPRPNTAKSRRHTHTMAPP